MPSRRAFLSFVAAALLSQSKSGEMIVRSSRPEDLEMPDAGFGDFITPIERFFVRSHTAVPKVDLADWRLKIEGHVSNPLTLTMEDLRKMPSVELLGVLECAGNGRAFYDPPVAGLQWRNGAAGNGRWRGVRLTDVLRRAGVKTGAVDVLFDGADVPMGTMADFQRSIPLKKALDPQTLLAYAMNGETLPVKHGFPLRVVVPGWAGDCWTKWLTSVRVLDQEATGFWMKNAYLYPKVPPAPGAVVAPEAMAPVTSLRVKSVIAFPENATQVASGKRIVVRGAAWSGDSGPVTGVDVSVDRGRTWRPARLTGDASPFGWRLWEYPWTPSHDGAHTLLARARDADGDVQPLVPEWNPSGYLWNAVARVDVNTPAGIAASPAEAVTAPAFFRETCVICHEDDVIRQQRLTRAQWDRELNKMIGWGARVRAEDRETLLDYLTRIAPTTRR
jgi:DMSO/TMAO reductase YedYZ molybdopterin-dependent catalytic subunit